MVYDWKIEMAEKNLDRQVNWLDKLHTKSTIVLGIQLGMLSLIFASFKKTEFNLCEPKILLSILVIAIIGVSIFLNWRSTYPALKTKVHESKLFFGHIANKKNNDYLSQVSKLKKAEYLEDLIHQSYVIASIVDKKYKLLKNSQNLIYSISIPWAFLILIS